MDLTQQKPRSKAMIAFLGTLIIYFMFFSRSWSRNSTGGSLKIRLYTNNIRYDNKNLTPGERSWINRRPFISRSIQNNTKHHISVVCLQEVLHNQLVDIMADLNESEQEWSHFGVGRTDGKQKGEYAPIFYKNSDWSLESSKTYWLSETPDTPSVGWDAELERIATEVILKNRDSNEKIKVLNTHFDHKGVIARRESIKLILSKMDLGDQPSFLCGDFNTQPTDEPYAILKSTDYKDSRTAEHNADENEPTFTGFSDAEGTSIIDYIWADPQSQWEAYSVLPNFFEFYMSDHRPVTADYSI